MARSKSKKTSKKSASEDSERASFIKDETRHGILAVVCFALTIFFIFAPTPYSGAVGSMAYRLLTSLFGAGFYAIPVVCVLLGISFFKLVRPHFVAMRLGAGLISFVALLGMISLLFTNSETITGGLVGQAIAGPLTTWFNAYAVVLLGALLLISLLVLFDTRLQLSWLNFRRLWHKNDEPTEAEPLIVGATSTIPPLPIPEPEVEEAPEPEPAPVMRKPAAETPEEDRMFSGFVNYGGKQFAPPPLDLLEHDSGKPGAGDVKASANIIKRTLANFGIMVEMDEISVGPSVTRFALKPAEGIKLSRIVALQNDLALALAAHPIRIEAPIPGKSLVGIEIPNKTKSIVGLASLVGSKEFAESPHPLLVSLGRGITGQTFFANVAKAPHMLIAGTTGSGKSVVIHTFITSLLYRNSPEQLRFIMIDPKRVELTLYNKIPHLLTPVVTDAKKAILALKWAIKEMERRYNLLEQYAVRDIQSFHKNNNDPEAEKMPYIVIIIDELADIMSTYPRELEASIVRLAQMSRAVGIHLILSTQRPSVEVITGLIKANIPSRVALQVASQIDSRTIIDMAGAEKLLGSGDMLYLSGDMSKPSRLQSAFITEGEVKKVTGYLAKEYADSLPDEIALTPGSGDSNTLVSVDLDSADDGDGENDELYEEAREIVIKAGKASASYLQRKLKVGYARAARLLDMLEERGVIGPGEGAKQREVYEKDTVPTE